MAEIQVSLDDEKLVALAHEAKMRNIPIAELVRRGIETVLREAAARRDPEVRRRAREAAGKFRSGLTDLSERHDEYFAEACEE
ncbi:MAG TPA: CopG family transcriptional regulator [Planctomycetota bacterium]|nr:CopG family transcriptional regulator [Planctomycetota bacterium]